MALKGLISKIDLFMRKRYYCYHSLSFHISETTYVCAQTYRTTTIHFVEGNESLLFFLIKLNSFSNLNGNYSEIPIKSVNKIC